MKKLFQTIFVSGAVYPIVYDAGICRRAGTGGNSGGGAICSGDSMGRSPCRRGGRPASSWRMAYRLR